LTCRAACRAAGDTAHAAHLLHLLAKVLEVEALALLHLAGELLGLVAVDVALGLLDQAQHVAHAEDAGRDAVGVEHLERVGLLADAEELDRLAGDMAQRQRRAAAGVAVDLGQDHAGQRSAS
jgi:hypothetical protein